MRKFQGHIGQGHSEVQGQIKEKVLRFNVVLRHKVVT